MYTENKKLDKILAENVAKPMLRNTFEAISMGDPSYLKAGMEEAAVNMINRAGDQVDVLCDVVDTIGNAFDSFAEGVDRIIDFFMGF